MKKTINILIALMVMLTALSLGDIIKKSSVKGSMTCMYEEYRVKPGDTLWDIARGYIDNSKDIRRYIYNIMANNNMKNSDIVPGQVILLPLK